MNRFYVYRDSHRALPEGCEGNYVSEQVYQFSGDYYGDATVLHETPYPVDVRRKKILDGQMVDMTEAESAIMDAAEAQAVADAEAARQAAKSQELKDAENAFLIAVQTVNAAYNLDIQPTDGFQDVMAKLKASTTGERLDRLEAGVELRTLWDVVLYHGGRWGDVVFHETEEQT